jgi:N-sulfoglucosamine sulfohydrolase
VGIAAPKRLDGRSFLPLLKGQPQDGRDAVFTQIDRLSSGSAFPMRCVQTERYGYIFNAWSDGTTTYSNANEGMTMRAMNEAAKTGAAIAERVRMFRNRALEEFYDLREDPDCLKNLINEPKLRKERDALVATLRAWMAETGDPLLKAFDSRQDEAARKKAMRGIFDAKPKATAGE